MAIPGVAINPAGLTENQIILCGGFSEFLKFIEDLPAKTEEDKKNKEDKIKKINDFFQALRNIPLKKENPEQYNKQLKKAFNNFSRLIHPDTISPKHLKQGELFKYFQNLFERVTDLPDEHYLNFFLQVDLEYHLVSYILAYMATDLGQHSINAILNSPVYIRHKKEYEESLFTPEDKLRKILFDDKLRYIEDQKDFEESQRKLKSFGKPGDFLLRKSKNEKDLFVLTNRDGKKFFLGTQAGGYRLYNPDNPHGQKSENSTKLYVKYEDLIKDMKESLGYPYGGAPSVLPEAKVRGEVKAREEVKPREEVKVREEVKARLEPKAMEGKPKSEEDKRREEKATMERLQKEIENHHLFSPDFDKDKKDPTKKIILHKDKFKKNVYMLYLVVDIPGFKPIKVNQNIHIDPEGFRTKDAYGTWENHKSLTDVFLKHVPKTGPDDIKLGSEKTESPKAEKEQKRKIDEAARAAPEAASVKDQALVREEVKMILEKVHSTMNKSIKFGEKLEDLTKYFTIETNKTSGSMKEPHVRFTFPLDLYREREIQALKNALTNLKVFNEGTKEFLKVFDITHKDIQQFKGDFAKELEQHYNIELKKIIEEESKNLKENQRRKEEARKEAEAKEAAARGAAVREAAHAASVKIIEKHIKEIESHPLFTADFKKSLEDSNKKLILRKTSRTVDGNPVYAAYIVYDLPGMKSVEVNPDIQISDEGFRIKDSRGAWGNYKSLNDALLKHVSREQLDLEIDKEQKKQVHAREMSAREAAARARDKVRSPTSAIPDPLRFVPLQEVKVAREAREHRDLGKEKLQTNIKSVIFDFDRTLVNGHFHNALMEKRFYPEEFAKWDRKKQIEHMHKVMAMPWAKNPEELKATIMMLIDNDFQVGIVSFTGYPDVVKIFLEELLGKELSAKGTPYIDHFKFGENVITGTPDRKVMIEFGKNPFIQYFLEKVNGKAEQTLFADDDPDNRKLAAKILSRANIINVTDSPIEKYDPNKTGKEAEGYHFLRDIRMACGLGAKEKMKPR